MNAEVGLKTCPVGAEGDFPFDDLGIWTTSGFAAGKGWPLPL